MPDSQGSRREFDKELDGPPRQRVFELLEAYEKFVATNRETIRAFVRWVLESPTMRESLQGELFALHGLFIRKVSSAITLLTEDPARAELLSLGLVSHLAGELLFELLDPDAKLNERRRESLRAVAERLLPEDPAGPRGRAPRS